MPTFKVQYSTNIQTQTSASLEMVSTAKRDGLIRKKENMKGRLNQAGADNEHSWFKVAVSVTDSDGPETYRSRCIGRVSADTQNKMIKIFKNY